MVGGEALADHECNEIETRVGGFGDCMLDSERVLSDRKARNCNRRLTGYERSVPRSRNHSEESRHRERTPLYLPSDSSSTLQA